MGELREALGRLVFATAPLEHCRPFLGPLFAWANSDPPYARPRLPIMAMLVMRFLAGELAVQRMVPCRLPELHRVELYRVDAKAEGNEVAIGGDGW